MKHLINISQCKQQQLNLLYKLLSLQSIYYSNEAERDILREVLFELGIYKNSAAIGLVNPDNHSLNIFVRVSSGDKTILNIEKKVIDEALIRASENGFRQYCLIKTQNKSLWIVYLINEKMPGIEGDEELEFIQPFLKALLTDKEGNVKKKVEVLPGGDVLKASRFNKSLDGVILELTEHAVVKRIWVKDHERRFLPSEFFKDKELKDIANIFGDIFSESIGKLMKTGERQECIYNDFDSEKESWYRAKFRKVYSGANEARIICEIEDIIAEKEMSDQLERNRAEIERINNLLDIGMDISLMGGWEYDLKTGEFLVTRQVSDIVEIDHFAMPQHREVIHCFSLANRFLLLRALKKSFGQGIPFDLELEMNCGSKIKKWVRIAGIPVAEHQRIRFFRGILKDISSNKRHQLELIEAKNMAEQVARKRTEILSIMSHEIRTPLNGIIGICNLLNQIIFEKPDVLELIQHLTFSSNHLLNLVNDILDLEKIRNKKMELNKTETNLIVLVEQIKKQFFQLANAKKIELKTRYSNEIPEHVLVDELRLSRILNNLVSNAIKFTETGEVCISIEMLEKHKDTVKILFKVVDTGIGIPDHFHNMIFDKFLQIQQASHRKQEGTGLGLSITKDLLKLFKSEIVLISKPGQGTTFEFIIDFNLPNIPKSKNSNTLEKSGLPPLPRFNLLIVDDNKINLVVTKSQVRNFGIKADVAESGLIALKMLNNKVYDIILIDLHMPDIDGYALAMEVQRIYPDIKRIIFTADILEEVRNRLKEMGISLILSKPFKPEEMHSILLRAISEKI